eukprot:1168561-Rhodomonas_salina.2
MVYLENELRRDRCHGVMTTLCPAAKSEGKLAIAARATSPSRQPPCSVADSEGSARLELGCMMQGGGREGVEGRERAEVISEARSMEWGGRGREGGRGSGATCMQVMLIERQREGEGGNRDRGVRLAERGSEEKMAYASYFPSFTSAASEHSHLRALGLCACSLGLLDVTLGLRHEISLRLRLLSLGRLFCRFGSVDGKRAALLGHIAGEVSAGLPQRTLGCPQPLLRRFKLSP